MNFYNKLVKKIIRKVTKRFNVFIWHKSLEGIVHNIDCLFAFDAFSRFQR